MMNLSEKKSNPQSCSNYFASTRYTVQTGDTISKIAQQNSITIPELVRVNPSINPYLLSEGQKVVIPHKTSKQYENKEYNIRFSFPPDWYRVDETRYEGFSGFFQVSAVSSIGGIEDVCKSEVFNKQMPYGSCPATKRITHLGQDAGLILPSDSQPPEMKHQAAFILRYPYKVEIQGEGYNYFVLLAHKEYIRRIVNTIRFIDIR